MPRRRLFDVIRDNDQGVTRIILTKGLVAIADIDDFDLLFGYSWCAKMAGRKNDKPYAMTTINKESVFMHRMLMPDKGEIDHIDGNGLNNRRENLRPCTHIQNCWNRSRVPNKSGFIGVYWHDPLDKWVSRIRIGDRKKHLGYFSSPIDAARAYDAAAKRTRREFAMLNFSL